jgi:hypothetical protein
VSIKKDPYISKDIEFKECLSRFTKRILAAQTQHIMWTPDWPAYTAVTINIIAIEGMTGTRAKEQERQAHRSKLFSNFHLFSTTQALMAIHMWRRVSERLNRLSSARPVLSSPNRQESQAKDVNRHIWFLKKSKRFTYVWTGRRVVPI